MWFVYAMLANVVWSITDVWASVALHRFEKSPVTIGWILGTLDVVILAFLLLVRVPVPDFLPLFMIGGATTYLGLLAFFSSLSRVDVSVSSAAWVFMSIGIALGGLLLFGETWTLLQTLGALLSICGVLLLTFWHKHVSMLRTCGILAGVGLLFVPHFLMNEYALLNGAVPFDVFFWNTYFHSIAAIFVPLCVPRFKAELEAIPVPNLKTLYVLLAPRTVLTMLATFLVIMAYKTGLASLVGVAENGQPFFLIAFAWVAVKLFPNHAPKELLTAQSVQIKVLSFCIVFTGLALLAF